ncbi:MULTISPECIES: DUF4297 family anti-phage-associated protein [Enterococcus]|uniref:DUF4297 family anti-phage-associated protein n=1 Tax=Enterococcus TaxID=1350 RepID=UPI0035DCB37C
MNNRDATDTIKGYFYQFDHYIVKILKSLDDNALIYTEGIEDIDIVNLNETTAVQCKYYEKTEYNHSVIKESILFMIRHFNENKDKNIHYHIYGHYKSGQEKLPKDFDIEFLKVNFLSYVRNKKKFEEHIILNLSDRELSQFLKQLKIDINGLSFDEQNKQIIDNLRLIFSCNDMEAEYVYNNALKLVKDISVKPDIKDRVITKKDFLTKINNKESLFNEWYLNLRSNEDFFKMMKNKHFSSFNLSPHTRIILIDCKYCMDELEIKQLLIHISIRLTRISKRQTIPFCPYVNLYGLTDDKLLKVKQMMRSDSIRFVDGHDFKGADFDLQSILIEPNYQNQIKLKIINEIENIELVLNECSNTRKIYQFYIKKPFYENFEHEHNRIPINSVKDIIQII